MRIALTSFLLFITYCAVNAQKIQMYKTFGGVRFERDSLVISPRQVQTILWEDALASEKFRQARVNSSAASLFGFAGGILIGIPLGTALIGGGDPEWGLALGGAALIGISIPFNRAFQRNAQDALDTYNQKKSARRNFRPELFLSGRQVGFRVKI